MAENPKLAENPKPLPKACPACGRVERDWTQEGKIRGKDGEKLEQLPGHEDRLHDYRAWRRRLPTGGAVTDFDQIEWRDNVPVALLEMTRVDGDAHLPDSYLQAILDRITVRDPQGKFACSAAFLLECQAWIVAYRADLRDFWVYNLTASRGWWHLDRAGYASWLCEIPKKGDHHAGTERNPLPSQDPEER